MRKKLNDNHQIQINLLESNKERKWFAMYGDFRHLNGSKLAHEA